MADLRADETEQSYPVGRSVRVQERRLVAERNSSKSRAKVTAAMSRQMKNTNGGLLKWASEKVCVMMRAGAAGDCRGISKGRKSVKRSSVHDLARKPSEDVICKMIAVRSRSWPARIVVVNVVAGF